mgnify:CR=1 FL=1
MPQLAQSKHVGLVECEENFGSQSPITKFHLKDNEAVRNVDAHSTSELDSPDKAHDKNLNQTSEDLTKGLTD